MSAESMNSDAHPAGEDEGRWRSVYKEIKCARHLFAKCNMLHFAELFFHSSDFTLFRLRVDESMSLVCSSPDSPWSHEIMSPNAQKHGSYMGASLLNVEAPYSIGRVGKISHVKKEGQSVMLWCYVVCVSGGVRGLERVGRQLQSVAELPSVMRKWKSILPGRGLPPRRGRRSRDCRAGEGPGHTARSPKPLATNYFCKM